MDIIDTVKKTSNKILNLFETTYKDRSGKERQWFFVSRKKDPDKDKSKIDAVVIVSFLDDKIVVLNQYRVPLRDYIYEDPAGIIDEGEDIFVAAKRELKEETGLDVITMDSWGNQLFNSCGMSDESCTIVFAKVEGEISLNNNEDSEEISVEVLTREEAKKIVKNKNKKISAKLWLILKAWSEGYDWIK